MDIFSYMNLKYGDAELRGLRHPFRIAALSNRKPSYEQDGKFPFVKLLSARKAICPKLPTLIDDAAAGKFPLTHEIATLKAKLAGEPEPVQIPARESAGTYIPATTRLPAGTGPDHRDEDMTLALDLVWSGLAGEALEKSFRERSQHLAAPSGYDRGPDRYVERTTTRAEAAVMAAREKIKEELASRKPAPPDPANPADMEYPVENPWEPRGKRAAVR